MVEYGRVWKIMVAYDGRLLNEQQQKVWKKRPMTSVGQHAVTLTTTILFYRAMGFPSSLVSTMPWVGTSHFSSNDQNKQKLVVWCGQLGHSLVHWIYHEGVTQVLCKYRRALTEAHLAVFTEWISNGQGLLLNTDFTFHLLSGSLLPHVHH